jgi:7-cyano-7-deazaguanine synthase
MAKDPKRVCVLTSGGIDSTVLVADMLGRGYEVHPLYIRCGFVWERAEQWWLERLMRALHKPRLKPLAVADAPMAGLIGRHWSLTRHGTPSASAAWDSVYLPARNLILLTQAALLCRDRGIALVVTALLKGNPFADATDKFMRDMEKVLAASIGRKIRIQAPYRRLSKSRVVSRVPGFPLHLTFSCLRPRGRKPCENCSKCAETAGASQAA